MSNQRHDRPKNQPVRLGALYEEGNYKMAPYQQNGFLGEDINVWIDDNRKHHVDLFKQAEKISSDCYSALAKARPHNKDKKELIVSCLFPRTMELFQGTYLLISRGMIPSSNVMLRALIETMFVLVAASKNDEALEAYILNDEVERLKAANKIIEDKTNTFSEVPIEDARRIKAELKKKIEAQKIRKYKTEDFARKAGLHDWYLTVYAVTSQSVHAAVKDMEQYLDIDTNNVVKSIKFVPTDKGTTAILTTACNALNMALNAFLSVLGLDTAICNENATSLQPFMEKALVAED